MFSDTYGTKGRVIVIATAVAITQGCSSLGSYTNGDYSCSGLPDGILCADVQTVYALTDGDDYAERINELRQSQNKKGEGELDSTESGHRGGAEAGKRQASALPNAPSVRGVLPRNVSGIVPLRTPAEVMRVYVRPWESKDGDLYVPGYLYTEIEARRWMIGDKAVDHSEKITVLSARESEPSRARNAGGVQAAGKSVRKTIEETLAGH